MSLSLQHVFLRCYDVNITTQFFAQVFDLPWYQDDRKRICFDFFGTPLTLIKIEKEHGRAIEELFGQVSLSSIESLKEFLQKAEFFYFRHQGLLSASLELKEEKSATFFDLLDPDQRIWRVSYELHLETSQQDSIKKAKERMPVQ